MPTTPWEGIWQGVAEWMGVEEARMDEVLPNAKNFGADEIFTEAELYASS